MSKRLSGIGCLVVAMALSSSALASGFEKAGDARFAKSLTVSGQEFRLNGSGVAKFARIIKLCAAALYTPENSSGFDVLDPGSARRLEIEYFVSVSRDRFVNLANEALSRQLNASEFEELREKIDALHRLYRDVRPGDRYALTFEPGRGLGLELNGEELGRIEGAEFANAYMGIWLGDRALSEPLRKKLIGKS